MASSSDNVVLQPLVHQKMLKGINQIVDALRPTLGPLPRGVVVDSQLDFKTPEILDDGALIARRIINLPDRTADVGAMLLRHMIGRLHESVGDGAATAAVMFGSLYADGLRYLASGGNAIRLRQFLEQALEQVDAALAAHIEPVKTKAQLRQVAASVCGDADLAAPLAEIFYTLGEYAHVDIRSGGRETKHEFFEGFYWEGGSLSLTLVEGYPNHRVTLDNAAVLISDLEIGEMRALAELIAQVIRAGIAHLMIVASKLSDEVVGLLAHVNRQPGIKVIAVKPPHENIQHRVGALDDLALLTGGQVFAQAAGHTVASVRLEQLGRAKRVWTDRHLTGMVAGCGCPAEIQRAFMQIGQAYVHETDNDKRRRLLARLGQFMGGGATLWVGGVTQTEVERHRALAKRAAETLRAAVRDGVLPGGGTALLNCRGLLCAHVAETTDTDERVAYQMLARAMELPAETLLRNAGYEPGGILHDLQQRAGSVFDVRDGRFLSMGEGSALLDVAAVQREVVRASVMTAATALTVDAIVHRKGYHNDTPPRNA